ncbi:MAG: CofH family radical SAM protein [Verrucomicrobia bacterium]|nr:CofH family radical SAM protein [bacterium]NBY65732.1 CofH family radical SAM protein [Verrucomicrobiota bacterium]
MNDVWKMPLADLREAAREKTQRQHGRKVTYVINRNANFSRICTVGCSFCGFGKRPGTAGATSDRIDEVVARVGKTPWVTEVCLQGGIDPGLSPRYYFDLVRALKGAFPWMHLHAFSPMEIDSLCEKAGCGVEVMVAKLRAAGVGTIPGTAAEILVDAVRRKISRNKLPAGRWVEIVKAAHRAGLRSSATILFGHVERWEDIRSHFEVLRGVQEETGGFTEFVPLAFVPYLNRLGLLLARRGGGMKALEERIRRRAMRLYPLARMVLGDVIPNLQTSWVKLGVEGAVESLGWGCNDFGGTLYEESITRSSGGKHGEGLEPETIVAAIRQAGHEPSQRTTLYDPAEKRFSLVKKCCHPQGKEHLIPRIDSLNPNQGDKKLWQRNRMQRL